jgi:hypothetical protein
MRLSAAILCLGLLVNAVDGVRQPEPRASDARKVLREPSVDEVRELHWRPSGGRKVFREPIMADLELDNPLNHEAHEVRASSVVQRFYDGVYQPAKVRNLTVCKYGTFLFVYVQVSEPPTYLAQTLGLLWFSLQDGLISGFKTIVYGTSPHMAPKTIGESLLLSTS